MAKKDERSYHHWRRIKNRCYNIKMLNNNDCYKNVIICDEWSDYFNYKEWYDKHYIEGWVIDKDLFSAENKIYSPTTCCFLPKELNTFLSSFTKRKNKKTPRIGVSCRNGKFISEINTKEKHIWLGTFDTLEDAKNAHNIIKQQRLNALIDKYKDQLEPRVVTKLLELKFE